MAAVEVKSIGLLDRDLRFLDELAHHRVIGNRLGQILDELKSRVPDMDAFGDQVGPPYGCVQSVRQRLERPGDFVDLVEPDVVAFRRNSFL